MTHTTLPAQKLLTEYLELDPSIPQGLRWKKKAARNTVVGSPAGRQHRNGYWEVRFQKVLYKTNRIVYRIATGKDPGELEVDHKDLDKSNNAASNLRAATRAEQQENTHTRAASGYRWVYWSNQRNKWQAQCQTRRPHRKCITVGYYSTAKEAHEAVVAHRNRYYSNERASLR